MGICTFISYAAEDRGTCQGIRDALVAAGIECWMAPESVRPGGSDWASSVIAGIKQCQVFLLIVSQHANVSDNVKDELEQAKSHRRKIIPFFLEPLQLNDHFELALRRRHWRDDVTTQWETRLARLAEEIRAMEPQGKPPAEPLKPPAEPLKPPAEQPGEPPPGPLKPLPIKWENPYDFDGTATRLTFKGREAELDDLVAAIHGSTHCAIFGLQRMGKTSLVEEGLGERLAEDDSGPTPILMKVDMQNLGDEVKYRDFLHAIIDAMINQMVKAGVGQNVRGLRELTYELLNANRFERGDRSLLFDALADFLMKVGKKTQRRLVLFLDEFSEVRKVIQRGRASAMNQAKRMRTILPHDLYLDVPFMHHLSALLKTREFKQHFTLIVSVRPFMAEFDAREDLQLLKLMKPITLYYLDELSAKALITEPLRGKLEVDPDVTDYLYRATAGHPYLLQFILKQVVDRVRMSRAGRISLPAVQELVKRMVNDSAAYEAQFRVLISDYSMDEVSNPKESLLGEGTLALIAKMGSDHPDRWVKEEEIFRSLTAYKVPQPNTAYLLSQLARTKILEEGTIGNQLHYRIFVPLLQQRFVQQNLHLKYFR
jgi:hypothetical protein